MKLFKSKTKKPISFQLASDIHLELPGTETPSIPVHADNLILLGDIGNPHTDVYQDFIAQQAAQFKAVYVIAGNHEFYKNDYSTTVAKLQEICDGFDNVTYLHKTKVKIPDSNLWLLGCTLWTHVPDDLKLGVQLLLNDYRQIREQEEPINVDLTNQWHLDEVTWLRENIATAREQSEELIICTHHAPSFRCMDPTLLDKEPYHHVIEATQLDSLFGPPVSAWFSGHTHYNHDFTENGTRVCSNQSGYQDEETEHDFRRVFKI